MSAARRRRRAAPRLGGAAQTFSCRGTPGAQYSDGFLGELCRHASKLPKRDAPSSGQGDRLDLRLQPSPHAPFLPRCGGRVDMPASQVGLQLHEHQLEDEACDEPTNSVSLGWGLLAHEDCLELLGRCPLEGSLIWMTAVTQNGFENPGTLHTRTYRPELIQVQP